MHYIRAVHVMSGEGKNVTFGIDSDGNVWLATDTGNRDPSVKPEYFSFSVHVFSELVHSLMSLAFAALRFRLTGHMYDDETEQRYSPEWHGTEVTERGVISHADAVSAYPEDVTDE